MIFFAENTAEGIKTFHVKQTKVSVKERQTVSRETEKLLREEDIVSRETQPTVASKMFHVKHKFAPYKKYCFT